MQIVFVTKKPLVWSADEAWAVNSLGFAAEFVNKSDHRLDAIEAAVDDSDYSEKLPLADHILDQKLPKALRANRHFHCQTHRTNLYLARNFGPSVHSNLDWELVSESVYSGYDSV